MTQATPQQIKKLFVFAQFDLSLLENLAQASQLSHYSRNSYVIHEGDRFPAKLHSLLSGQLLIKKTSASGKETVLRQLHQGEMFAAPALFGDGIAPADVVALKACQVITIEKPALLQTISSKPEIALEILSCLNQRLQEMHRTIHGLASEKALLRLVHIIQYHAERYGTQPTQTGACLRSKLPHQQLSRMIGISYEECVRLINRELPDVIQYGRGGVITLQDERAFKTRIAELEKN